MKKITITQKDYNVILSTIGKIGYLIDNYKMEENLDDKMRNIFLHLTRTQLWNNRKRYMTEYQKSQMQSKIKH